MKYSIEYSCISHIGNCRSVNQDNFICEGRYRKPNDADPDKPLQGVISSEGENCLFGVFDGMGGEECGEVASLIAAQTASEYKFDDDASQKIVSLCFEANKRICDYTSANSISSMGTTAAMLIFTNNEIYLCNIGDSKVFRLFGRDMDQISYDHVAISAFGKKPPLSQNLGIPQDEMIIEPYISKGFYHDNDRYLICSDGLTDMVGVDRIKKILYNEPFEKTAGILLKEALANGGKDNITIITIRITEEKQKSGFFRLFRKSGNK